MFGNYFLKMFLLLFIINKNIFDNKKIVFCFIFLITENKSV